jgi:DNA-binding beta-propeller fold protein YncE
LNSWGEGDLPDAHGMFIDADDNLYMPVKNSHVVLKYRPDGNLLMTMGEWDKPSDTGWSGNVNDPVKQASGPFNRPSDIALDAAGDLYISDGYGNSRVHKFTADGELLFSWGEPGKTGPGEFHVPHGVWVHTDGRVFVADRENNRIQIFDADGKYLEEWGGMARPCDIYIDADEILYVPELDGFMSILSLEGDIIATWDSPLDAGIGNGAHAVWVDSHGDIYVNQNVEGHRLVKYIRQ